MARPLLDENHVHMALRERMAGYHASTLREVQQALAQHPVVVVGMRQNPFVKKACQALDAAGVQHHDLIYGSYFAEWKRRGALKMWAGWPTFPMVFVKGMLVGGFDDLRKLIDSGELRGLLA
jgi:monothiol glutaredoxin